MEAQLIQQKKSLLTKIPDIKNALQAVSFLMKKQVWLMFCCIVVFLGRGPRRAHPV